MSTPWSFISYPLTKCKLRAFKTSYTYYNQYDGDAMFFVIVKIVQPGTRAVCLDIKYKLENMEITHYKRDIPKANLQIAEWMN